MSEISLRSSLKNGYTVENLSRSHSWLSDEPLELEGNDLGPKPSELFLSALASCKLITMRMHAQRKGWDLQDATIGLRIIDRGEKTLIEKSISFDGELTQEQKKRLIDISGRCPVAKMVSNSVEYKFV